MSDFQETPLNDTFSLDATLLPMNQIIVGERMRVDYGELDSLVESLKALGQLQPIVVALREDGSYLLVAGGRRYAAATKLGWTNIQVVIRDNIDEATYRAMELAENFDRKAMTWQEGVRTFAAAFAAKQRQDHMFDLKLAGRFFNKSEGGISMLLTIAKNLDNEEVSKAENTTAAYRVILGIRRKEAEDLQAARSKARVRQVETKLAQTSQVPSPSTDEEDLEDEGEEDLELTEPDNDEAVDPVDEALVEHRQSASRRVLLGDCVTIMESLPAREFHAIITDFPYGIDMENLTNDVSMTASEHGVDDNLALYERLFAPMYRVLKEHSFAVCFIDLQHFNLLTSLAEQAGFTVCNWPLIWVKTTACSNQAPFDNFTKTYESAIVLKKGKPKLNEVASRSDFSDGLTKAELERFTHPFSKPRRLTQWIAKKILSPGSIVLDPFCGRGSMICALTEAGHSAFGIDMVESHVTHARECLAHSLFNPSKFNNDITL